MGLTCCSRRFPATEIRVGAKGEEVDAQAYHVPGDNGSRDNQYPVVNPKDLKAAGYGCHPRIHTRTRPPSDHRHQIRQDSKGGSQASNKAENIGTVKPGKEQALRILGKLLAAANCQAA